MKKIFAALLGILMLSLCCSGLFTVLGADSAFLQTYEMEEMEKTGLITASYPGASGGKITYSTAGGKDYRMSFTVNAPKAGDYAVWVRAYVKSSHQCTFVYTENSVLSNKIFKMAHTVADSDSYVWYALDARDEVNGDPSHAGKLALEAGNNTFEWQIRSIANVVDNKLVNDGVTKTTHYFDCVIVTDDLSFDPKKDWKEPEVQTTEKVTTAPMEKIDFHTQIEAESMTLDGMKTMRYSGASEGSVIYADAEQSATFKTKINIPKAGDYTVWIRVFAKSQHQSTFFYTTDSVYGGKIAKLIYPNPEGGFVWLRADVRTGVNDTPITEGRFTFAQGEQTLGFMVRSLANVEDSYLTAVNGVSTKSTHYVDAIVVTGDPDWDPNPKEVATTTAAATTTAQKPAVTTQKPQSNTTTASADTSTTASVTTVAGGTTVVRNEANNNAAAEEKSGCGSAVALIAPVAVLLGTATVLCRRRRRGEDCDA